VELVATRTINFNQSPYTVVFNNNGTANANGWAAGGGLSYAFQISSGTVNAGDVVYVGGSTMAIAGTKLRIIDCTTQGGDGFGNAGGTGGVLGNGGANADGIAVFNVPSAQITSTTIPVDAIFFGTGLGTAVVAGGTAGYQLPLSDIYPGGKLQSTSFIAADPGSGVTIVATGVFNRTTGTFSTGRGWATGTTTDGTTSITLQQSLTPATVVFASNNQTINENAGTVNINLTVSNSNAEPIFVELYVKPISNASTSDYSVSSYWLSIPAATNGTHSFPITITNDNDLESDEYLLFTFSGLVNATAGANNHHTFYIKDNDNPAPVANNELLLSLLNSFSNGGTGNSAEIVVHDPGTQRLFIANSIGRKLDIVNFANPSAPVLLTSIDLTPYGNINSVDVYNGIVACSIEDGANPQDPGKVVFFDASGNFLNSLVVGAMPDMVKFTHNGTKVLTANEGEPTSVDLHPSALPSYTQDPNGSISIIDVSGGIASLSQANVTTIDFTAYNGQEAMLRSQGIRLFGVFGGASSASQDLEPEYISISEDDQVAWITMQENNAIAKINLSNNTLVSLEPLGFKDHSLTGNAMDVSDQTAGINLSNFPVKGMYMPDAIANFTVGGITYIVTANEGDAREYTGAIIESVRLSTLNLDATAFPNGADLKRAQLAGRLNVTNQLGDIDNDGDFDEIYAFGARSFTIWNGTTGALIYDSGDQLERTIAQHPVYSTMFNVSNANNTLKNRSDDKGPEPEGVATATINGIPYLFVSLERVGGVMAYNVTNPASPQYVGYWNNRNLAGLGPDLGAEGIIYINAAQSPNGNSILILANEVSSTLSIFQVQTCQQTLPLTVNSSGNTICANDDVTLSVSNPTGANFQWIKDGNPISGETSSSITVNAAGAYQVQATSVAFGCSASSTAQTVVVNALPTVGINASSLSVCAGSALTLSGTGAQSYSWDNSVADGVAFSPSSTLTYTVVGTDINNCQNSSVITVPVNSLPNVGGSVAPNPVCIGSQATFTGNGASSYVWDNGVSNGVPFVVNADQSFTVTGTDANGCTNSTTVTVSTLPLPVVNGNVTDNSICAGESVTFSGSGAVSYAWSNGVTNGLPFSPSSTQTYTVSGTGSNGCVGTAQVTVTVNPIPAIPVITVNMDTLFSATADNYQWYFNGSSLAGQTNQYLVVSTNGNYYVVVTSDEGCSNQSTVYNYNAVGVQEANGMNKMEIFPNPFNHQTTLRIHSGVHGHVGIRITDAIGRTISNRQFEIHAGMNDILLSGEQFESGSGVYFISIETGTQTKTLRLVKVI
ncbi:MAG TPA: choice-of-anchor I family protein, partial [Flavobacteriales bacterium]|nr:choice-of-anchor I family protein [Flavobacteriales bacterium]